MERNGFDWVNPNKIKLGDFRVRTSFDKEKLEDLKRSIKRRDLLAPIVVKDNGDETYTLIAGERRLIASKELGLNEVPVIIRKTADADSVLIEMGVENIQREDLSYYERGRWVAKMKELGWTITALAEETGKPNQSLFDWLEFYEESERIKTIPTVGKDFEPTKIPLTSLLKTKRAPISEEKKTELVITASKLRERPTVREIERATRIIEQEPETTAEEAIERARGITYLLPVPSDLMPSLQSKAEEWDLGIQETIVKILREYLSETYLLPVIPTTGTFYIEEAIGEKLDGCIESYKSISASHAKVLTDEMPYKWVTFKQYKRPKMYINYDRQTYPLDSFTLPMIVELARKYDLGELWIHKLILHLVDDKWKDRYYTFKNKPISQGSDAERFIYNYYRKRKMNNWIETIPRRHLELTDVSGLERYYWQVPKFIRFLNRRTHGLVLAKEVQKISDEKTVDLRILEKW